MEAFEYRGNFFLPQLPEHILSGIIQFDPIEGATLEIIGDTITHLINQIVHKDTGKKGIAARTGISRSIDIILGYTNKGEPITLDGCRLSGHEYAVGYVGSKLQVRRVIIGCHFEKPEDIIFDKIIINYSYLGEWYGASGFNREFSLNTDNWLQKLELSYKPPEETTFELNDLNVSFHHSLIEAGNRSTEFNYQQSTFVTLEPRNPSLYEDLQQNYIYFWRNFLSLATGTAVIPISITGLGEKCKREAKDGSLVTSEAKVYYTPKGNNVNIPSNFVKYDMLFRFEDVEDNFEHYLKRWFSLADKLRPVLDIYFGMFYIPSMYLHLKLLTLAQALETYHRRLYDGLYMPEDEFVDVYHTLINAIPAHLEKGHRDSLKKRFEFLNEFSLTKRLKLILSDILAPYKKTVTKLVGKHSDFAKEATDARNYLTHYSLELEEGRSKETEHQYEITQKLKLIMQFCFMREMDFPPELVEKLMSNNQEFTHWVNITQHRLSNSGR